MLSFGHAANEMFSIDPEEAEALSRAWEWAVTTRQAESGETGSVSMRRGDEVVFDRLDLAETLGIWRNARGRVVGIHGWDGRAATIDVQFEGHAVLERYLPGLFRRVH